MHALLIVPLLFICAAASCPIAYQCPIDVNQTRWGCCPSDYSCMLLDPPLAGVCVEGAPTSPMTAAEAIWVGAVAALKADRIPRKCISNIGAELNALEAALTNFENGRYSAVIKNLETIFQEGISSLENCHKKESFWDELVGALEDVLAAIPEFAVIRTVWDTVEYVIDGVKITEDVEAMLTAYKRAEIGRNANQMVLVGQHIGNILNTVIQMQKKK